MEDTRFNGPLARALRQYLNEYPRDPWSEEVDRAARLPDATPLCTSCLAPQELHRWKCPHCGYPGGDLSAFLPLERTLLEGELFRRGVLGPPEERAWITVTFVIFSLVTFTVFAPLYWFWMLRRASGTPIAEERRELLQFEDEKVSP